MTRLYAVFQTRGQAERFAREKFDRQGVCKEVPIVLYENPVKARAQLTNHGWKRIEMVRIMFDAAELINRAGGILIDKEWKSARHAGGATSSGVFEDSGSSYTVEVLDVLSAIGTFTLLAECRSAGGSGGGSAINSDSVIGERSATQGGDDSAITSDTFEVPIRD